MDYLEEDRTINGAYYEEELRRLRQDIVKKRRRRLTRDVMLLQGIFSRFSPFGLLSVSKSEN